MQALILAGGLGTRLRSVVSDLPKVMAEVAGRPFLAHLLDRLASQGFTRVVLAVSYKREAIMAYFGDRHGGLDIAYSIEMQPLGTGGAIRQALGKADAGPCFVLNGDTWLELDYATMLNAHCQAEAAISMAVKQVDDVSRFGALDVDAGRVKAFLEKGRTGAGTINAGVYVLETGIFDATPLPEQFSFEADFLMPQLQRLRPLVFETAGDFIDIGVPDDYFRAQRLFAAHG